uniref:Peptidase S8/S53 domain-containing protein n=1 Tax=Phenylobacterium glaciei TaxID=2803784 RepID=A0A974P106_9CAUL|nr:hypothetical protein JKL49_14605 [Phenylobacterium glaciei]
MARASTQGGYVALRGTSFAAPLVAGRLALDLSGPDRAGAARAITDLSRQATDLARAAPIPSTATAWWPSTFAPRLWRSARVTPCSRASERKKVKNVRMETPPPDV